MARFTKILSLYSVHMMSAVNYHIASVVSLVVYQ